MGFFPQLQRQSRQGVTNLRNTLWGIQVCASAPLTEVSHLERNYFEFAENCTFLDRQLTRASDGTGDNGEFIQKDLITTWLEKISGGISMRLSTGLPTAS
jgi:hypothetical protein